MKRNNLNIDDIEKTLVDEKDLEKYARIAKNEFTIDRDEYHHGQNELDDKTRSYLDRRLSPKEFRDAITHLGKENISEFTEYSINRSTQIKVLRKK